ncbi:psaL [Symbiodinium natans]|uniref:PsaL protein n=1 Tax=Symbiodinium natans TaxID=878477 RepID=A0A812N5V5_9DINO|nr:psaL [Symbiodinium natans]
MWKTFLSLEGAGPEIWKVFFSKALLQMVRFPLLSVAAPQGLTGLPGVVLSRLAAAALKVQQGCPQSASSQRTTQSTNYLYLDLAVLGEDGNAERYRALLPPPGRPPAAGGPLTPSHYRSIAKNCSKSKGRSLDVVHVL